jgi:purine-binding chemotaxis protein CheW
MNHTAINETGQYLTFKLDQETYALDITQVREVLELTDITKVPLMPEFMRGVINLRGGVVPVVDLRVKLGLMKIEKTIDTCIIIIELTMEGERAILGALADSVQEVLTIDSDQIVPPPKIGTRLDTEFIKGMGKTNDQFAIILDIDRIFSSEDLMILSESDEIQKQAQG